MIIKNKLKMSKGLVLLIMMFLLALPMAFASGSAVKGETFDADGSNVFAPVSTTDQYEWFTSSNTGTLTNVSLEVFHFGTPTKVTEVLIYTVTTNTPVTLIANFTPIGISQTTADPLWYNFSGAVNLTYGNKYAIVLHSANIDGNMHRWNGQSAPTGYAGNRGTGNGALDGFSVDATDRDNSFILWFNSTDYMTPPAPPVITEGTYNFTFTASNSYNLTSLSTFGVTLKRGSSSYYITTESGTAHITNGTIPLNDWNKTYTLIFNTSSYFNTTLTNINLTNTGSASAGLVPHYYIGYPTYSNYITAQNRNYTRTLNYSINYSCRSGYAASLLLYTNETLKQRKTINCLNTSQLFNSTYSYSADDNFSIYFRLNYSSVYDKYTKNQTFTSDITNPTARINFTIPYGFYNPITNITLWCTDTNYNNLTFNLTFNNIQYFYGNKTTGNQTNESALNWGTNTALGKCKDLFGSTSVSLSRLIYAASIYLIDEKENALFNLANVTGARVYFDNNRSYYDFKANNNNSVNFTIVGQNKLRFEFTYSDGGIITRYVDVSLFENENLRVCINKEGVEHYQQLITASSEKVAILKNLFSNCVIAADYIRFAYQDTLILPAYSISSLYYLYTHNTAGEQLYLAAVDGSISTYINLDQIEFGSTAYDLNILQDAVTFDSVNDDEIRIYYQNIKADNTALDVTITRMNNNEIVFNTNDFTNYNEFTLYFDYSTLNVTNETLFKIDILRTTPTGEQTLTRYFNTNASSGVVQSIVVFIASFLLAIFGLTFIAARTALSYFGVFIMGISLSILFLGVTTWYITLLGAIEAIVLIFILINLVLKNYPTLIY